MNQTEKETVIPPADKEAVAAPAATDTTQRHGGPADKEAIAAPVATGNTQHNEDIQADTYHNLEQQESADLKKLPKVDGLDEFGGHRKTDPAEIALVKKLDRYMLVR